MIPQAIGTFLVSLALSMVTVGAFIFAVVGIVVLENDYPRAFCALLGLFIGVAAGRVIHG